ncbi:hypothetical protein HDV02_002770, partial [Globomyces sp. JEL0801]
SIAHIKQHIDRHKTHQNDQSSIKRIENQLGLIQKLYSDNFGLLDQDNDYVDTKPTDFITESNENLIEETKPDLIQLHRYQLLSMVTQTQSDSTTVISKSTEFVESKSSLFESTKESQVDESVEQQIQNDLKIQQELTDLLAQQSAQLLKNSQTFNDLINKDKNVLDSLEDDMQDKLNKVQSSRSAIQFVTKKTWTTTFMIWGSILVCILVFSGTLLWMRLFSPVQRSVDHHVHVQDVPQVDGQHSHSHTHVPQTDEQHSEEHHHHYYHHEFDEF